ncbi:hypothetical protein Btru_042620 [Bulinus truncatus]|nr:hypothetical protein Btru_042620 [Bulinus truncatus]
MLLFYYQLISLICVVQLLKSCFSLVEVYPKRRSNNSKLFFRALPYELIQITCSFNTTSLSVRWNWTTSCKFPWLPKGVDYDVRSWFDWQLPDQSSCTLGKACKFNHTSDFVFQYHGYSEQCTARCTLLAKEPNLHIEGFEEVHFCVTKPPLSPLGKELMSCYKHVRSGGASTATIFFVLVLTACILHYNTLPPLERPLPPGKKRIKVTEEDKKYIMKIIYGDVGNKDFGDDARMSEFLREFQDTTARPV